MRPRTTKSSAVYSTPSSARFTIFSLSFWAFVFVNILFHFKILSLLLLLPAVMAEIGECSASNSSLENWAKLSMFPLLLSSHVPPPRVLLSLSLVWLIRWLIRFALVDSLFHLLFLSIWELGISFYLYIFFAFFPNKNLLLSWRSFLQFEVWVEITGEANVTEEMILVERVLN